MVMRSPGENDRSLPQKLFRARAELGVENDLLHARKDSADACTSVKADEAGGPARRSEVGGLMPGADSELGAGEATVRPSAG
jgi:hypothetical protein